MVDAVAAGSVLELLSTPEVVAAAVVVAADVGPVSVVGCSEMAVGPDVHALSVMTPTTMTVPTRVVAAILGGRLVIDLRTVNGAFVILPIPIPYTSSHHLAHRALR